MQAIGQRARSALAGGRPARRQLAHQARRAASTSVYTWGAGDDGQLGHPTIEKSGFTQKYSELAPRVVAGLEQQDVADIACGFKHSAAATEDGRVLTWGKMDETLLGHAGSGDTKFCLQPMHVGEGLQGVKAKAVSCGEKHTAALAADGSLFTWGTGGGFLAGATALGLGDNESRTRPEQVKFGGSDSVKLSKISSGRAHMLGLGVDGELWSWGSGELGRLGNGTNMDQAEPFPVDFFLDTEERVVDIACGSSFSLALTASGQVYGWGKNDQSQLGLGGGIAMDMYAMESVPRLIETLTDVVKIAAGGSQSLAIDKKGRVFAWGNRLWIEPHEMTALSTASIVDIACGNGFSMALSDAGEIYTWGKDTFMRYSGVLGHGDTSRHAQPTPIASLSGTAIKKIAAGNRHAAALTGLP